MHSRIRKCLRGRGPGARSPAGRGVYYQQCAANLTHRCSAGVAFGRMRERYDSLNLLVLGEVGGVDENGISRLDCLGRILGIAVDYALGFIRDLVL